MLSGRNLADVVEGIEKATTILGWVGTEIDTELQDNAGQSIVRKSFSACFCTFDGDKDDVTSSLDTESKDFTTIQEAYDACRHFINICDGYLFAGCYIEHWTNSGCKTIFNYTCENLEMFYYIDSNEVEFDAFNTKYHVYMPKFTAKICELFTEFENAVYTVQQARYFKGKENEAVVAADHHWNNIIENI